jgi:hypothetical protein
MPTVLIGVSIMILSYCNNNIAFCPKQVGVGYMILSYCTCKFRNRGDITHDVIISPTIFSIPLQMVILKGGSLEEVLAN